VAVLTDVGVVRSGASGRSRIATDSDDVLGVVDVELCRGTERGAFGQQNHATLVSGSGASGQRVSEVCTRSEEDRVVFSLVLNKLLDGLGVVALIPRLVDFCVGLRDRCSSSGTLC